MVDTAVVFQIENERAAEAERLAELREFAVFLRQAQPLSPLGDCLNSLIKRQRELEEERNSSNLREHVVRMEK